MTERPLFLLQHLSSERVLGIQEILFNVTYSLVCIFAEVPFEIILIVRILNILDNYLRQIVAIRVFLKVIHVQRKSRMSCFD